MEIYGKIRILLRLAELCSPSENERKVEYMNRIDEILKQASQFPKNINELSELFDYDSPPNNWSWKYPREVCNVAKDYGIFRKAASAGHDLSLIASLVPNVRKKHAHNGTAYFLPPFKIREQK